MMKRFDDWMSVVLVRRWMLVLLFAGGFGAWLLLPVFMLTFGLIYFGGDFTWGGLFDDDEPLNVVYALIMAILYGAFRGVYFHPLLNVAYGESLARTPWRYPAAMTLGPARLVWQDAVVALILIVVAILPPAGLRYVHVVPIAMLATHGIAQCVGHWQLGAHWSIYSFLLLTGVAVLFIDRPMMVFAIAIAVFLLGRQATWFSLCTFPYSMEQRRELRLLPDGVSSKLDVPWRAPPIGRLTWPYRIGPVDAMLGGILIAWLTFCFSTRTENSVYRVDALVIGHVFLAVGSVGGRLFMYVIGHAPPISLVGRVATGRWIIPRYDVVLVAPLLVAVLAYAMPSLLIHWFDISPLHALPLATATTIAFAFGLPPKWEDWHLRSHCRESLGVFSAAKYVKTS